MQVDRRGREGSEPGSLVPPAYGHVYACMISCDHEADSPLLEGRATQEAADAVGEDGRSGGGTHPPCD